MLTIVDLIKVAASAFSGTCCALFYFDWRAERRKNVKVKMLTAAEVIRRTQGDPNAKSLVIVLAAMLLAGPASATTRYVNHALGLDSNAGTAPGASAWKTIGKANSTATDTVQIAASDTVYDTAIKPVNPNTTWIADSTAQEKCTVPGADIKKFNTKLIGMRLSGTLIVESTQFSSYAKYCAVRKCTLVRGYTVQSGGFTLSASRCGTDSVEARGIISPVFDLCDSVTIMDCTGNYTRANQFGEDKLLDWEPSDNPTKGVNWHMSGWRILRNRWTLRRQANQSDSMKWFMFRKIQNAQITDNHWTWLDQGAFATSDVGNRIGQGFVVRDSIFNDKFRRDTLEFLTTVPGKGDVAMLVYSSGNNVADSSNAFTNCYVRSNINLNNTGVWWEQRHMAANDSIYQCVVVDSAGSPAMTLTGTDDAFPAAPCTFEQNTIANLGGGEAAHLESSDAAASCLWGGPLSFRGNIFYSGRQGTMSGSTDVCFEVGTPSGPTSLLNENSNLYFVGANPQNAIRGGTCGGGKSNYQVAQWAGFGIYDAASHWGSPQFVDSTFATFNPHLLTGSAAIGAGPGGVDCGAYAYVGDATPPAPITDLTVLGSGDSYVELGWTATGDDGFVGTATSYDLRYSTSPITSGNFSAATNFSTNMPPASGNHDEIIVSGLAPNTTYYFAIEIKDEVPNTSAISNVVSAATRKTGTLGHLDE